MSNELKSIFKYLLDFARHPEQYNDDMVALLKVEQVIELLNYIDILNKQLQQEENIRKEIREYIMTELITEWNIKNGGCVSGSDLPVDAIIPILEILDKGSGNNG